MRKPASVKAAAIPSVQAISAYGTTSRSNVNSCESSSAYGAKRVASIAGQLVTIHTRASSSA